MYMKAINVGRIDFVTVEPYSGGFIITISINNQKIQKSITYNHIVSRDMIIMLTEYITSRLSHGIFLNQNIFKDLKRSVVSTIDSLLSDGRYSEIIRSGREWASLDVFGINYNIALRSKNDSVEYEHNVLSRMDGKNIYNKTLAGLLDDMIKENENGV